MTRHRRCKLGSCPFLCRETNLATCWVLRQHSHLDHLVPLVLATLGEVLTFLFGQISWRTYLMTMQRWLTMVHNRPKVFCGWPLGVWVCGCGRRCGMWLLYVLGLWFVWVSLVFATVAVWIHGRAAALLLLKIKKMLCNIVLYTSQLSFS